MTGYPRDLVGYADQPPDPRWPGGARLAVNVVVNYEEGGERSVLHGDKVAETRLTDLLMPAPLQGARDLNMESAYEYGSRVGFWRLMRVFAERQVIPTIYAVGMALENFASVMNLVIFPMFFASSALYPLWHVKEASLLLYEICEINPFTHAVELIRFALYGQLESTSAIVFVV